MNDDLKLKFDLYVRRLSNSGWDEILERGMETVKIIGEVVENPGPINITRAAMAVARTLSASDIYYAEVLPVTEWKPMFPTCIKTQLLEILEPRMTSKLRVNRSGETYAYFISESNVRIGWVKGGDEDHHVTEILAHVSTFDESVKFAREMLWKTVDLTRIVLTTNAPDGKRGKRGHSGFDQLRVATDDLVAPASSEFATEYAPYLKKCMEQNVNRTILFYGPPGSGKSTISRTLCDILKLRSLRVRVEDVGDLGSESLGEMIKIFDPDVVIFDDLDRAISQVALLETLENLHKRVRFVFATVNHINHLQPALLRPGRFDELIEVAKLDATAVHGMLGEFDDAFEVVKNWPVAFVNEYIIRRKLLGPEKALATLDDLQKRIERLIGKESENCDDDEDD